MQLTDLLAKLNADLLNEYKHMNFYLHAANVVRGMGRMYVRPYLLEQAKSEMDHVTQFAAKIAPHGITPAVPAGPPNYLTNLVCPKAILRYALEMEKEVVANYHERRKEAEAVVEATGQHYDFVIFLEDQIEHSQEEVDELRMLLSEV